MVCLSVNNAKKGKGTKNAAKLQNCSDQTQVEPEIATATEARAEQDAKPVSPMKKYKGWEFNIFSIDNKYEGWVFDTYRQVKVKTHPRNTQKEAIKDAHYIIYGLNKGFSNPGGIMVDAGKPIREREAKEREEKRKQKKNKTMEAL